MGRFPWRSAQTFDEVLESALPWLEKQRIVFRGGYSESVIAAEEALLKSGFPADLRRFYLAARPIPLFTEDGPGDFGFYEMGQGKIRWEELRKIFDERGSEEKAWEKARGLLIGQTGYGDGIYWVTGLAPYADGCVAINDHELAYGDLELAVLARSFKEFIGKIRALGGIAGQLDDEERDDLENAAKELAMRRLQADEEYHELNDAWRRR